MAPEPIPAIVQARMTSTRLPGKMLRRVAGRPVLGYVLDRLEHSGSVGPIVVATSEASDDDPIAEFCRERHVACTRGPLEDVAGRFERAVEQYGFTRFFRVCGDRPLLDDALLDRAAGLAAPGVDLVTNVHPKSYPSGQTVELVAASAFVAACARMREPADREHVTRFFYQHRDEYRIVNFTADVPRPDVHLALDTEEDLRRFAAVVGGMERPHWSYGLNEVLALYEAAR